MEYRNIIFPYDKLKDELQDLQTSLNFATYLNLCKDGTVIQKELGLIPVTHHMNNKDARPKRGELIELTPLFHWVLHVAEYRYYPFTRPLWYKTAMRCLIQLGAFLAGEIRDVVMTPNQTEGTGDLWHANDVGNLSHLPRWMYLELIVLVVDTYRFVKQLPYADAHKAILREGVIIREV